MKKHFSPSFILSILFVFLLAFVGPFSNSGKAQESPVQEQKVPVKVKKPSRKDGKAKKPAKEKPAKPSVTTEARSDKTPVILEGGQAGAGENQHSVYKPIVESTANGKVDWTNQFIEARGQSVVDTVRFKNKAQARAMARRGAIVEAQRNLLEIVQGVQVTSETTVRDMIAESDYILSRVDGVIKNAQVQGEAVEKDGLIEITLRIPMYENDGLAPVVVDALSANQNQKSAPVESSSATTSAGVNELKELVFDFKGKQFDPTMFPVILDENNQILLDLSKIYDPKSGKFPKIISASKELLKTIDFKEGQQVVEVLESFNGKIKVDNSKLLGKVNWGKVGKVAGTVGKFLLTLLVL
jgi:hypothetical protein